MNLLFNFQNIFIVLVDKLNNILFFDVIRIKKFSFSANLFELFAVHFWVIKYWQIFVEFGEKFNQLLFFNAFSIIFYFSFLKHLKKLIV